MKKEDLTAAQRIMLAKGHGIYEPKSISKPMSLRTELILGITCEIALLFGFLYILVNEVMIKKTAYSTALVLFIYLIIIARDLKKVWKRYQAEQATATI